MAAASDNHMLIDDDETPQKPAKTAPQNAELCGQRTLSLMPNAKHHHFYYCKTCHFT